jgi:hypothetical protein
MTMLLRDIALLYSLGVLATIVVASLAWWVGGQGKRR